MTRPNAHEIATAATEEECPIAEKGKGAMEEGGEKGLDCL